MLIAAQGDTEKRNEEKEIREPVIYTTSSAELTDTRIRNLYEYQVLASLGKTEKTRRLERYYCVTDSTPNLLKDLNKNLRASINPEYLKYFDRISSAPNLMVNQDFECDLYLKSFWDDGASYKSVLSFLGGATQEIFQLGKEEVEDTNMNAKWVLIEMSESPELLAHKLYQLERALSLLPGTTPEFNITEVGALVILLNGRLAEAKRAISYIDNFTLLKIFKFPVYIGWVPTRNIYAALGNLENKVEALGTEMKTNMKISERRILSVIGLLFLINVITLVYMALGR